MNNCPPYPPLGHGYSTAGGRELELASRPPARFISLSNLQRTTKKKDTETKKTSRHRVTPLLAQRITLSGNSYFWRTARWAKVSRKLLAERFAQALGAEADPLWDGCHNSITPRELEGETVWVHRKGAVVAAEEAVVIPGSRGALSYLIQPLGDGESRAWSLAHGAGRKWARSEARLRMRERFGREQLVQTSLGGRVICGERDLLYEEAPAAYKNIEAVIQDLVDARVVSVVATLRPLLTYKTRADQR